MASIGCGTVPRRGTSSMLIVRRSTAAADWFESHAASCARALSIDTPGFRRPMISMPTLSSPPRLAGLKSARRDSGAQKSGALTSRPRNPSGITPIISNGAPVTSTVRPSTSGSRLKWRCHPLSLSTITGLPPARSSSAGLNARPITGLHADDIEEAARHEVDRHHPAVDTQIDLGQRRVGVRKDARFRTQRFETRTGEQRRDRRWPAAAARRRTSR